LLEGNGVNGFYASVCGGFQLLSNAAWGICNEKEVEALDLERMDEVKEF
jgi:hypothetical protein